MSKPLGIFAAILLLSILTVILFFNYSKSNNNLSNGFQRKFTNINLRQKAMFYLGKSRYIISEISQDSLILYEMGQPQNILKLSLDLKAKKNEKLALPVKGTKTYGKNLIRTFGDKLVWLNGASSMAYILTDKNRIIEKRKKFNFQFRQSEAFSLNSLIMTAQTNVNDTLRRIIKKVNWKGDEISQYLLEKQSDGYFCSSGQFQYDRVSKLLIYLFHFRGNFLCLDTNLNLIYQAKTIDTVKTAIIQTNTIKVKTNGREIDKLTPSKIPNAINKRFSISNESIYINSNLKAENEDQSKYNKSDVIDVYNLKDGKYKGSFYLPKNGKQKLTQIIAHKNYIVAVYNEVVITYSLPIIL